MNTARKDYHVEHSSVSDYRRENLRNYIDNNGGATAVAKRLGYSNPSFLAQMTSGAEFRDVSEKNARRFEKTLGLSEGTFDVPCILRKMTVNTRSGRPSKASHAADHPKGPTRTAQLISQVSEDHPVDIANEHAEFSRLMALVQGLCAEDGVDLTTPKFVTLVNQAMLISEKKNGALAPDDLKPLISLMKP